MKRIWITGWLCGMLAYSAIAADLVIGVDANYIIGMEQEDFTWHWANQDAGLLKGMAEKGIRGFRTRLWMNEEGMNGKQETTALVKRVLAAGLDPYLVIFLADDWADMMKQPLPAIWKDLSFEERLEAVRNYSRDIVLHFRELGLTSHLYEIGNEIDYGICGEYPSKSGKKTPEALSRRIWPRSAEIIRASQQGVLEADPEARFMLHISHWWDPAFCKAFFQYMIAQGLQVDYAGLSYFPTANIGGSLDLAEFARDVTTIANAIQRPIIIPEVAYPSTRDFKGQFSRWKYDAMGYPLTPEGQQRWLADFLALAQQHPAIHSIYYWSPEWAGEGMWKAFALFSPNGNAKPAWASFLPAAWKNRTLKTPRFVELARGQLFPIPVEAAKAAMSDAIQKLRKETGGVNVEHIQQLDKTACRAGDFNIRLRSSLQHNMILELDETANGFPITQLPNHALWPDWLTAVDGKHEALILVVREDPPEVIQAVKERLDAAGLDVILHPKGRDGPIRFGMSGVFTADGEPSATGMY